jgi:glycosyltransferase involved in cell wall biosynthesis
MTATSRSETSDRARPRVLIAHDWMTQFAGSERCVLELTRAFPNHRIYTAVLRRDRLPPPLGDAAASFVQRIPGATSHHEWFLPLMPVAWETRRVPPDVDVVVSSSHSCAKGIRVPAGLPHLCYCHTPMRYAWHFDMEAGRFPRPLRLPARAAMAFMRMWDVRTSQRVTKFVANSSWTAAQIGDYYGRTAEVVHPPVQVDFFTPGDEPKNGFFLCVGRLVAYKRPDIVVRAFAELPHRLVVVGDGPLRPMLERAATRNVHFVRDLDDVGLRELYRGALAMIHLGIEDFGITLAEAQSCGTPVIAFDAGGARDIVRPGLTGWLISDLEAELVNAVSEAVDQPFAPSAVHDSARRFAPERFRDRMVELVEQLLAV